jgi:hypothetical protein
VIEQLEKDKLKLTTKLNKSEDEATKARELKQATEEEMNRLKIMIQAAKMDKQILEQEVQNLKTLVEYFRYTMLRSVDEFLSRLKFNINNVLPREFHRPLQDVY